MSFGKSRRPGAGSAMPDALKSPRSSYQSRHSSSPSLNCRRSSPTPSPSYGWARSPSIGRNPHDCCCCPLPSPPPNASSSERAHAHVICSLWPPLAVHTHAALLAHQPAVRAPWWAALRLHVRLLSEGGRHHHPCRWHTCTHPHFHTSTREDAGLRACVDVCMCGRVHVCMCACMPPAGVMVAAAFAEKTSLNT